VGAGFKDIDSILSACTSRTPVLEEKAQARVSALIEKMPEPQRTSIKQYDSKTAPARLVPPTQPEVKPKKARMPLTPEQRELKIRRTAAATYRRQALEAKLVIALKELKLGRAHWRDACEHGRRVFSILVRWRMHPMQQEVRLLRARKEAAELGVAEGSVVRMEAAAQEASAELEREGRMDWLPTRDDMERMNLFHADKAEWQLETAAGLLVSEVNKQQSLVVAMVQTVVVRELEKRRFSSDVCVRYQFWVAKLVNAAIDARDDDEGWRRRVEAEVLALSDPELARAVSEIALAEFLRWKKTLLPRPQIQT